MEWSERESERKKCSAVRSMCFKRDNNFHRYCLLISFFYGLFLSISFSLSHTAIVAIVYDSACLLARCFVCARLTSRAKMLFCSGVFHLKNNEIGEWNRRFSCADSSDLLAVFFFVRQMQLMWCHYSIFNRNITWKIESNLW